MMTSLFKDRARAHRDAASTPQHALAQVMATRTLAAHKPVRHCEIGPFVVDYVFRRESLVVELEPRERAALDRRAARTTFLNEMGYSVLSISPRELRLHPQRVLKQIAAALK